MSREKQENSHPTRARVRNAEGLTADEKLLLYTVASHHTEVSFGTRDTLMRWTGLSERRFRRARRGALDKGVLIETPKPGRATTYRIGEASLKRLAGGPESKLRRADTAAPTVVNTPDHAERAHHDHTEQATLDRGGPLKENKKRNQEDIKNMKPPRKVRPPRRDELRNRPVDRGTMDDKKARLRERLAKYTDSKDGE